MTKRNQITLVGNIIGHSVGIYLAYKNDKPFWTYVGYFVAFGIVGAGIGYGIGYAIDPNSQEDLYKLQTPPKQKSLIDEMKEKEAVKKTATDVSGAVRSFGLREEANKVANVNIKSAADNTGKIRTFGAR